MASCPPPSKNISPPPMVSIDFLDGKWKIPWTEFNVNVRQWGPGSYRQVPTYRKIVGLSEPLAKDVLKSVIKKSKKQFKLVAGDMKVSEMIDPKSWGGQGMRWRVKYGPLEVVKKPGPNESIGSFRRRGGWLIASTFLTASDAVPLENVEPSWLPKHSTKVDHFTLHVMFVSRAGIEAVASGATAGAFGALISKNLLEKLKGVYPKEDSLVLFVQMVDPVGYEKAWDTIVNATQWLCSKISNEKLMAAAAAVAAFPSHPAVQASGVAWVAVAAMCNRKWPACPQADGTPAQPPGPGLLVPTKPLLYPAGSIAWFHGGVYRIAKPIGTLNGLQPTHIEVQSAATVPAHVAIVGRTAWESATLPWYKRTWVLVAAGLTAAAGVGTVAYAASR